MVNGLVMDGGGGGGGGVTVGSAKSMLSNNGNNTITSINVNSSIIRSQRSRNAQQHPQQQQQQSQSQSSIQSNMSAYHSSASSFMNNNNNNPNNNSNSTFNNNVSLNHGHSHHHHGSRSSLTSTTGHGNGRHHHHHHHHHLLATTAAAAAATSALHSSTVTTTVTIATTTTATAITTASSTHSSSLLNSAANVYSHGDSKTSSTNIAAAASALDDDDDATVVDLVDGNVALSGANNCNNNNSDNVAAMADRNNNKDVGRIVNANFNSPSSSTISIRPTNYILLNKLRVQQKHRQQIRRQPSTTTTITTTTTSTSTSTSTSTLSSCTSNNTNNNNGGTGTVNDVSVLGKLSSSNSVSSVFGSTIAANHKTSGSAALLMSRFNNNHNKINNVMESSSNGQRSSKSILNNDNRFSTTTATTMPGMMLRIPRITGHFMQANNSTTRPIITKVNASYWMNRVATNFSSSSANKKKKDSGCNSIMSPLVSNNNNNENKKLNPKSITIKNRMQQQQQQQTKSSSENGNNNLAADIYNNVPSMKKSDQSRNQFNESSSSMTKNNRFSSASRKPSDGGNDNVHENDQYGNAFRQFHDDLNPKSAIGKYQEQPPKMVTTTETITSTVTTATLSSDRRSNPNNDVIVDIDVGIGDGDGSKSLNNKHQMTRENDDHNNCDQKNDLATVVDMIQCDNNNVETIPVNTNTNVDMKIGCNMMKNLNTENCSGQDVGKVANNNKTNESSKNQIKNILKFIEKSSPEFLFLLDKSANLSYQMALFEKKLDYLEKIFSNNDTSNETLENGDSKRNDCEESILWSKVINRTRNWIKKSREKNLFLTNVELKPNVKRQFETKQQIIDEWKNLANNKQKNIFSTNQDDDGDKNDGQNEVDDSNASPFVSLSSKDELIILLERIAQFSSDIASQQHRKPSEKRRSIADHGSRLILEKKNVFSKLGNVDQNIGDGKESSQPKTQPLLSSIREEETLKNEDSAARTFLMKLLGNQDLDSLAMANDGQKSPIKCSKELLDRLQPDILKALVQIVKTNSLLVQVQREFDQLMCAHLKSYSQSLSKAKNKQATKHNNDGEHCNHENQFMGISLPTSFNQTKRFHNNNSNNNFNQNNVRIRGQLHQPNMIPPMANGTKCNSNNTANTAIVAQSITQKHHLSGTPSTMSPSQQQCCKMNGTKMMFQDGDQYGGDCKLQNCMNFASDGDSGGEFTATTVTNEFNQCVTEDELSSLLNQIQLCSQKIIERSSGTNGSVNGNSGNLAISSSNNSTSSSGCCCSTGSEMKCNGTCSINQSQNHHHHQHHNHNHNHQHLQQRLLLNKDDETNQSVPPLPSSSSSSSSWPNRLVGENKCCCLNESMDRFGSSEKILSNKHHLAKQKLQENQNFMGWPLDPDPMMANVTGNNMTGFMLSSSSSSAFDLMSGSGHQHLGPGLHGLNEAGCLNAQQATVAAAVPSATANARAFIFDPNVDVESFLNVIEKELDENRFTSAPPFMSQDAATYLDNPLPPLNYHNHRRLSNHRCSTNKDSNDHPVIDETAFCCQPRPQPGIITSASYFSSPLVNITNNNANVIVGSNPVMMPMIRSNADVHHHSGSDHCPCSFNNNNNNSSNNPRSYPQQHQSLILAGGNWKLSQRAATVGNNSMNECGKFNNINSIGNNSHYSSTMTSSLMANGSVPPPSSSSASMMMMASAAADNHHHHQPYLVHQCQKPQQQMNQFSGNNNRHHLLHRKETNNNHNNNDLLDQYRSQVSCKINEETDRQLKEIDQWLYHHLEQTTTAAQQQQTHLSRKNSNTGQNIIPSSTNTDYEPIIINNNNNNNNNAAIKPMQHPQPLSLAVPPKAAAAKLDSSSKNV